MKNIIDIKNEIKFGYQRLFRGYDDRWFWSISNELTPILIDCIKFYKKEGDGYPKDFKNREEWVKILDDILLGFQIKKELYDINVDEFESEDDFIKEYKHLEKIKIKGMKLFSKYYDCLWN
jgi:hypothetical protein